MMPPVTHAPGDWILRLEAATARDSCSCTSGGAQDNVALHSVICRFRVFRETATWVRRLYQCGVEP
jgi:hypothetical protein